MEGTKLFLEPIVQYGFLGFCVVLLAMVFWLTYTLVDLVRQNNKIIAAHTEAMNSHATLTKDLLALNRSIHDKLISRPCIAKREMDN